MDVGGLGVGEAGGRLLDLTALGLLVGEHLVVVEVVLS
jgi:hypothetical protein